MVSRKASNGEERIVKDHVNDGDSLTKETAVPFKKKLESISNVSGKIQEITVITDHLGSGFGLISQRVELAFLLFLDLVTCCFLKH